MVDQFCTGCGSHTSGSQFCQNCGRQVQQPAPFTASVPPIIPEPFVKARKEKKSSAKWWWIGGAAALAIAVGVATTFVLLGSSGSPFAEQASSALSPVLAQDKVATSTVAAISPTTAKADLHAVFALGVQTIITARTAIDQLNAEGDDLNLRTQLDQLLATERQWMDRAAAAVLDPTNQRATEITSIGENVAAKRLALTSKIPSLATASFPSSTKLSTYLHTRAAALDGRAATIGFLNQVMVLVNQSGESFSQVNHFFTQLNAVANGGQADMTLSQAEDEIAQIIAARSREETQARNLTPPNAKSKVVADRLAEAFSASLANDQALSDCLYQDNNGSTAYIYRSCLSSTTVQSGQASAAKASFISALNTLRSTVGLPAVQPRF